MRLGIMGQQGAGLLCIGVLLVSSPCYWTPSRCVCGATAWAPVDVGATKSCVCVWSTACLSPACTDATLFLFQIITADFSIQSCHSRRLAPQLSGLLFFHWIICVCLCTFFYLSLYNIKSVSELRGKTLTFRLECVPVKIFPMCQAGIRQSNLHGNLHHWLCRDSKSLLLVW